MSTSLPTARRSLRLAGVVALTVGATVLPGATAQAAAVTCDRVVAAGGSDSASGTAEAPFASVNRLAEALSAGQTGCVRGTVTGEAWVERDGIRLTSEPGQRGRLLGVLEIWGDRIVVEGLDIHGPEELRRPTPSIYGDDVVFRDNDVTNGDICVALGTDGHHGDILVERVLLERNRIHDCGQLPRTNNDHGIYVEHTLDARIVDNVIVDNADRGIQLYPNAQRTLVQGNVIDGNGVGVIFSGTASHASNGNVVRGNVIGNAQARYAIESWYPEGGPTGRDNLVEDNCLYGAKQISEAFGGFVARNNRSVADPGLVDAGGGDLRLAEGSACLGVLTGQPGPAAPVATPPVAAPAAPAPTPVATKPATTTETAPAKKDTTRPARRPRRPLARARPASRSSVTWRVRRATGKRARVEVQLRRTVANPVRVRLDVRGAGRRWRMLDVVELTGRRPVTRTLPLGARPSRTDVRARLVQTPLRRRA